jgi:hypothetical protein
MKIYFQRKELENSCKLDRLIEHIDSVINEFKESNDIYRLSYMYVKFGELRDILEQYNKEMKLNPGKVINQLLE